MNWARLHAKNLSDLTGKIKGQYLFTCHFLLKNFTFFSVLHLLVKGQQRGAKKRGPTGAVCSADTA